MSKDKVKIDTKNWKDFEDTSELLYSYLKKKGKHQRAKEPSTTKKL